MQLCLDNKVYYENVKHGLQPYGNELRKKILGEIYFEISKELGIYLLINQKATLPMKLAKKLR